MPQLPRATSAFSRFHAIRSPLGSSFARYNSTGGEEKVKGQVIGIDLGKLLASSSRPEPEACNLERSLTYW